MARTSAPSRSTDTTWVSLETFPPYIQFDALKFTFSEKYKRASDIEFLRPIWHGELWRSGGSGIYNEWERSTLRLVYDACNSIDGLHGGVCEDFIEWRDPGGPEGRATRMITATLEWISTLYTEEGKPKAEIYPSVPVITVSLYKIDSASLIALVSALEGSGVRIISAKKQNDKGERSNFPKLRRNLSKGGIVALMAERVKTSVVRALGPERLASRGVSPDDILINGFKYCCSAEPEIAWWQEDQRIVMQPAWA